MKKIAYIIPSLDLGGSELKTITLVEGLDKSKFLPIVITITKKGLLFDNLIKKGIPCFSVNKKHKLDIFVIRRIKNILKQEKIDIVQTFTSTAKLWGRLAAIRAKTKIIISTEESLFRGNLFDKLFEKLFAKKTSKIICNSLATKESAISYTKLDDELYEVIYNGIDLSPFLDIKAKPYQNSINLLSIARFDPRKGIDLLIYAMDRLKDLNFNVHLNLVGDGKLEEDLKKLSTSLMLDDYISFHGFQSDVIPFLEVSDIFILASREEGFGNVIVEAMAASRATVASRVGGIKEIIEDEVNGLLFEKDNLDELVRKVVMLINNEDLKDSLVKNARADVSRFSKDNMIKEHEALYIELLERKNK